MGSMASLIGARGLLAVAAAVALAGCDTVRLDRADVLGNPAMGYLKDPEIIVATTDWSAVQSANIVCKSYDIQPHALSFEQGRPYRLRLSNPDDHAYYFTAEAFFKNIAVQKLVSPAGEATFPYYEAILLEPGEGKDLYFVPVGDGAFEAECSAMWNMILGNAAAFAVAKSANFDAAKITATSPTMGDGEASRENVALDPELRARQLVINDIRTATREELEAIKTDLARMQELVEQREAELGAAGN